MNISLLVVDDSAADRILITEYLARSRHSFDCKEVASGRTALSFLQSCKPDCILVDFMMHDMNGIEFLERLAKSNAHKPPMVFISGYLDNAIIRRAYELGIDAHIDKKDFSPEHLEDVVLSTLTPPSYATESA